jgi:hypothetical protein
MKNMKKKSDENVCYVQGCLNLYNLAFIKSCCDSYGVQIDLTFKPDEMRIRVSKKNPDTGRISKSEQHVFKNKEIGEKFTTDTIEIIINNLLRNWYPNNILST